MLDHSKTRKRHWALIWTMKCGSKFLSQKKGGSKFGYPQIIRVQFRSGWPCMLVPSRPVTGSIYLYLHQVLSFLSLPWNSFRISISKTVGIMNHQLYDYEAPLHGHRVNFPRTWSTRSVWKTAGQTTCSADDKIPRWPQVPRRLQLQKLFVDGDGTWCSSLTTREGS
jgi:hypothetical protein